MLAARVADAARAVRRRHEPRFVGFLDQHGRLVAERVCEGRGTEYAALFWGGYPEAERVMLGLFPDFIRPAPEAFPVACVRIAWRFGRLSHRDFLGALLSLGIRRDCVGDIVAEPAGDGGECRVVLSETVAGYVRQSLQKVGGSGVTCEAADGSRIHPVARFADVTDTVASCRLDCVVAALCRVSRAQAGGMVADGLVRVDFEVSTDRSAAVAAEATVSIRGHGRFVIDRIGPPTRKGRLKLSARQYV